MNLEGPLWRPVPVEEVALRCLAVPAPFDRVPQLRDATVERFLGGSGAVEVLASGEQTLHEERGFNQVSAVVEHAEDRHGASGGAVHVMRPDAVITVGVLEEVYDL